MERGAIFCAAGIYRYSLWRRWHPEAAIITFVMLNPSIADAEREDATLRCCIRFAQTWGYGALEVVNLFALVATDPKRLKQVADPIGDACDQHLTSAADRADLIIVAWGNGGGLHHRDQAVLRLLEPYAPLYCMGRNQAGQPRHPLYLPKQTVPMIFQ